MKKKVKRFVTMFIIQHTIYNIQEGSLANITLQLYNQTKMVYKILKYFQTCIFIKMTNMHLNYLILIKKKKLK